MLKKQKKIIDLMIQYIKDRTVDSKTKALKKAKEEIKWDEKIDGYLILTTANSWFKKIQHLEEYKDVNF